MKRAGVDGSQNAPTLGYRGNGDGRKDMSPRVVHIDGKWNGKTLAEWVAARNDVNGSMHYQPIREGRVAYERAIS